MKRTALRRTGFKKKVKRPKRYGGIVSTRRYNRIDKYLPILIKELDRVFSIYIRLRDCLKATGTREVGICVTCNKSTPYKEANAGHYIKRQYKAVRYHERNVHLQCVSCNKYRDGMQDEYASYILNNYGIEAFNELMMLKKSTQQFKPYELEELIKVYRRKTKELT